MEQRDFGIKVRQLREQKGLLLRQIAAALEVDTALVSKIERGERKASKEQIMKIAELLEINPDELLVIWLSDKIVDMLQEEPLAYKVLKNSENQLKNK